MAMIIIRTRDKTIGTDEGEVNNLLHYFATLL